MGHLWQNIFKIVSLLTGIYHDRTQPTVTVLALYRFGKGLAKGHNRYYGLVLLPARVKITMWCT